MNKKRVASHPLPLPWVLWATVLAIALLGAYVHLLTSAVERGESLRRPPAGSVGLIDGAAAAAQRLESVAGPGATGSPAIPQSHVAFIVVP